MASSQVITHVVHNSQNWQLSCEVVGQFKDSPVDDTPGQWNQELAETSASDPQRTIQEDLCKRYFPCSCSLHRTLRSGWCFQWLPSL